MPGSYVKDAYKPVYRHPSWKEEAKEFESAFALSMYKDSKVVQSAHSALVRLANVLNAYYGSGANAPEEKVAETGALAQIAAQLTGERDPMETVHQEAKGKGEEGEQQEEEAPFVPERGEPIPGEVSEDLVTPTVTKAFLKNYKSSAGQVGVDEKEEVNRTNVQDMMGLDGNLREKMTMMYNAALLNGGMEKTETDKSISLKRLVRDVTDQDVAQKRGLQGLNMKAIKKAQGGIGDVMSVPHLAIASKFSPKRLIKALMGNLSRKERNKDTDAKANGLGYQYYQSRGIGLSSREEKYAVTESTVGDKKQQDLAWREGKAFYKINKSSRWAKAQAAKGRILTAGPSGTTARMLSAYKFLGASQQELLQFRLGLMGWMITSQDHSMYEIFLGSHLVGVKGKENIKEAAEMYRSIDPLTIEQIRDTAAARGREFPHERVYSRMLDEVTEARQQDQRDAARPYITSGQLTSDVKERDQWDNVQDKELNTQEKALNIYTTAAYKTMNFGQVAGNRIARIRLNRLINSKDSTDTAFKGDFDKKYLTKKTKKQIFDALRASNRMSAEALDDYRPDVANPKGYKQTRADTTMARGWEVYRGSAVPLGSRKFKTAGNTITLSSLTSTSKSYPKAAGFLDKILFKKVQRPVMMQIDTQGLVGRDIQKISQFVTEQEVLLPGGTKLEVTEPEKKVEGAKPAHSIVKLKVIAAPDGRTKTTTSASDSTTDTAPTTAAKHTGAAAAALSPSELVISEGAESEEAQQEETATEGVKHLAPQQDDSLNGLISPGKLAELSESAQGNGASIEYNEEQFPDMFPKIKKIIHTDIFALVTIFGKNPDSKMILSKLGVDFADKKCEKNIELLTNLYFNYTIELGNLSMAESGLFYVRVTTDFVNTIKAAIGIGTA